MMKAVTAVASARYRPRWACGPSARKVSSGPYADEDRPSAPSPTHARKATSAIEWRVSAFIGSSGLPRIISRIFLFFMRQAGMQRQHRAGNSADHTRKDALPNVMQNTRQAKNLPDCDKSVIMRLALPGWRNR